MQADLVAKSVESDALLKARSLVGGGVASSVLGAQSGPVMKSWCMASHWRARSRAKVMSWQA